MTRFVNLPDSLAAMIDYQNANLNRTQGNFCQSDQDCGIDATCHLFRCKCNLGYVWWEALSRCQQLFCQTDDNCTMAYTKCRAHYCFCQDDYYLDWNSQTCKFSYISSLQIIERSVPIVVVLVALLLLSSAIARCYYLRKRQLPAELSAFEESPNTLFTYYDQLVINDRHNYPPPPPYTPEESVPKDIPGTTAHFSTPPPVYSTI